MTELRIFDCHFHLIDPRFPLVPNQGYTPDCFTLQDYRQAMSNYRLCGGAVVSGSFQAYDQSYLITALNELGTDFVGVTQLPTDVSDETIMRLNQQGIHAVRFNLRRYVSQSPAEVIELAQRVYQIAGWHSEFYLDTAELDTWFNPLNQLPAISIDHLGLSRAGFKRLLKLVECGAKVKATGFGRTDLRIKQALLQIHAANPEALMFGTDLPSTRSPTPYSDRDLQLIRETFDEREAQKILSQNAINFYRKPQ